MIYNYANYDYKPYKEEILNQLFSTIQNDEFNDIAQISTKGDISASDLAFIKRHYKSEFSTLEIGCGSGRLIDFGIIADVYLEPSLAMINRLVNKLETIAKPIHIYNGVAENIPITLDLFDLVIFMNGFFQTRSEYEALIEINRVLRIGGKFIFNLCTNDEQDIVCGRVLGYKNYIRLIREFGFEPIEVDTQADTVNIAIIKQHEFDYRLLRKMQFIKDNNRFRILNYFPDSWRDSKFL